MSKDLKLSTNSNDKLLQKFLLQEHLGVEYLKTQKWSVNSKWFRFWIGVYMYLKFYIISEKTKYILVVYIHFLKPTFTGCLWILKEKSLYIFKIKANVLKFRQRNSLLKSGFTVFLIRELSTTAVQKLRLSAMSHQYQNILSYFVLVHLPSMKREKRDFF